MGFAGGSRTPRGPATGVILSKNRARKASKKHGGGTIRGAWQLQFTVKRDLAYDLDMRKIIDFVSVELMEHYRKSVRAGRTPGGRHLPPVKPKTKQEFGGRSFGFRSGYMADNWWRGKIRGGPFRCFVLVKPYGGDGGPTPEHVQPGGRAGMIKAALKRGIDFQSVRGPSRTVIQQAFDFAVSQGFGDVRTPRTARVREGLLPELRVA